MSNLLEITVHRTSAVIRFTNPRSKNALSRAALGQLHEALDTLGPRADVERLIFTGTEGVFAAGADLREIAELQGNAAREFAAYGQNLIGRITSMRQETVAAVNGHCFGGALDLALACSKRFSVPSATFCHPGARLGIITGWGGTQRLPRLIGVGNALMMFLTAGPIPAHEALRIGLIDAVSDDPVHLALSR